MGNNSSKTAISSELVNISTAAATINLNNSVSYKDHDDSTTDSSGLEAISDEEFILTVKNCNRYFKKQFRKLVMLEASAIDNFGVRKSDSISKRIVKGFANKEFGPAPLRTIHNFPACYYKMKHIDELTNAYANRVLVIGPGKGGSSFYHSNKARTIVTIGPIENDFNKTIDITRFSEDYFINEMIESLRKGLKQANLWTLENDAMDCYTGCPTYTHYSILSDTLSIVRRIPFKSVVLKIFLTDENKDYNRVLLKLLEYYADFKIIKPNMSSFGTTERYLVLRNRRTVRTNTERRATLFFSILNRELMIAFDELSARRINAKKQVGRKPIVSKTLADRQMARINDVYTYLNLEYSQTLSQAQRIFEDCRIGDRCRPVNNSCIKAYVDSDILVVLKYDTNIGAYKTHKFPGMEKSMIELVGDYDMIFDGEKFIDVESIIVRSDNSVSEAKVVLKPTNMNTYISEYAIAFDALRLFQCKHKLDCLKFDKFTSHDSKINLIEGVPGCGKTYEIIHTANADDLILTVARKTKEEIETRIHSINPRIMVNTVDSYLINNRGRYKKVFLDEGLMIQPGEIDIIANLTQAEEICIYGDRKQLNFIPRVAGYIANFDVYSDFDSIEFRNVSYRCPRDVAKIFYKDYCAGFYTKNEVLKSINVKRINNSSDIVDLPGVKYLVFTQAEKKELLKKKINVNTIHEVQGMTFPIVHLVRLNAKQLRLYDSAQHILVALTRHTKEFLYLSTHPNDKVIKTIGGAIEIDVMNYDKATHMAEYFSKIVHKPIVEKERPIEFREVAYYIDYKPEVKFKEFGSEIHKVLYGHLKDEMSGHFRSSVRSEAENFDVKPFKNITDIKLTRQCAYKINSPGIAIQGLYDDLFPSRFPPYAEFDEFRIETEELEVNVSGVTINTHELGTGVEKAYPCHTYESVIRTHQPSLRPKTARQTLLALAKRNCDAPRNALPSAIDVEINKTIREFKRQLCIAEVDDMLNHYQTHPVSFNDETLAKWVNEMEIAKAKRFDWRDSKVGILEALRYSMMIKNEPKNRLEANAESEYGAVQNIIHYKHTLNALFGAIFKQLFDRFIKLLKPNVLCMLKKNITQLNDHLNNYMISGQRYSSLEIDFAKYDKSQLQMCYELEMYFLKLLGFDFYLWNLWKIGHFDTPARDFINGITAYILYQRKSGDPATCFGNTLINMMVLARSVDLSKMICASFIGDDSFIEFFGRVEKKDIVRTLSEIFNLDAKLIDLHVTYICSAFIVDTGEGFVYVPDPIKRIERLGKKLYIEDESELFERYVSFQELMGSLEYHGVYQGLIVGITERYGDSGYTLLALESLRTIAKDFSEYKRLFRPNPANYKKKTKKIVMKQ